VGTIPEAAVWAIFFLPLAAFIAIGVVLYPWRNISGWTGIAAIAASFLLSLWALNTVIAHEGHDVGFGNHIWVAFFNFALTIGITLDGLTGLMVVVVTGVSLMVQVYSIGYMKGDAGYSRYFAYLSLFTASMLGLVLSRNLLLVFVFWELVGLSSYLLIGFWFHRPGGAAAAKKTIKVTPRGGAGGRLEQHGADLVHPGHLRRRRRQVGPVPAARLVARRDGGSNAGLGPDPRRDDGRGRRVSGRPPIPGV
jgi:NADH-quinone oxidoreductase subunit L